MIWTTAKSTDVNRRQSPWPSWANGLVGAPAALAACTAAGVATGTALDADRGASCDVARGVERSGEVGLEVLDVLETDRHAQQTGRDARCDQLLLGQLPLGGGRRMDDERVDAPERGRQLRERHRVDDRLPRLATTFDLEGEHAAGGPVAELADGDLVLWVAREARVHDADHTVLTLEPGAQCRRIPGMPLHPHAKREQTAQDEERVERADGAARVVLEGLDAAHELDPTGDHPRDDVAVATEELRRRLDDQIGPELDRPAHIWRGERVVDQ